jgi:two-component system, sensor histidine kinase RpfC
VDHGQSLTLLGVDDEPANLLVYEHILRVHGHRMVRATSPQEALEALRTQSFDAVIMDIHMPGMTGLEVVKQLRIARGPNRDVRVIAVTADTTAGKAPYYIGHGFDDYMPKPVEVRALLDTIGQKASLADRMKRRDVIRAWVIERLGEALQ